MDTRSRHLVPGNFTIVYDDLVNAFGLNEAIFLQKLYFYGQKYGEERDGHIWVRRGYDEWSKEIPFISLGTIRRVVAMLEKSGVLVSTQDYNVWSADKTKWYRIDHDQLDAVVAAGGDRLRESADDLRTVSSPSAQSEQIRTAKIAQSNIEKKERSKEKRNGPERSNLKSLPASGIHTGDRVAAIRDELFAIFYGAYPPGKAGAEHVARDSWYSVLKQAGADGDEAAMRALMLKILDGLGVWLESDDWEQDDGKFIPTAANFLYRQKWMEEPRG